MTVADVLCNVTRTRGVTEVSMDHDLEPMFKDWDGNYSGNMLQYLFILFPGDPNPWPPDRTQIQAESKGSFASRYLQRVRSTHFVRPKTVDGDLLNVRYSQFGRCFTDYNKLPNSPNLVVVWEVHVGKQTFGVA